MHQTTVFFFIYKSVSSWVLTMLNIPYERYGLWKSFFLLYRVRRKWCVGVIWTLLLLLLNKLWIRPDVAHSWERFSYICAEFGSSTLPFGLNLQRHETSSLPVLAKPTLVDRYVQLYALHQNVLCP